jgi:probable HAF family extracellular repeat protein
MKTILTSIAAGSLLAALAIAQSPRPRYTVHDLGTLPGGTFSSAFDINDAGWVAGSSNLAPGSANQHAFLWYGPGHMTDLGTLGGLNSEADGPNLRGDAAVLAETDVPDPNGEDVCGLGTHLQCLAAVWRNGKLHPLRNLPGGNNSQTLGINNRGQLVGFAETDTPDSTCIKPQVRRFEAVIWGPDGEPRVLKPLEGDTVGFGFGINDEGQAVGASGLCSNTTFPENPTSPHAVLWEKDGTPVDLGNLGGTLSSASAINNRGDVDGAAQSSTDGNVHAFLWTRQTRKMQDLGLLEGDSLSVAPCCRTVNDSREVVGFSCPGPKGSCRAFYWGNGEMRDLNDLIPGGSSLYLTQALAINSRGQIAGIGTTSTGESHAFLATPIRGKEASAE